MLCCEARSISAVVLHEGGGGIQHSGRVAPKAGKNKTAYKQNIERAGAREDGHPEDTARGADARAPANVHVRKKFPGRFRAPGKFFFVY